SPGTERRQLTVLSCAVVDATSLAGRLDLKDLHDVLMRYHAACTAEIQRYGGHIAHYRGEGTPGLFWVSAGTCRRHPASHPCRPGAADSGPRPRPWVDQGLWRTPRHPGRHSHGPGGRGGRGWGTIVSAP